MGVVSYGYGVYMRENISCVMFLPNSHTPTHNNLILKKHCTTAQFAVKLSNLFDVKTNLYSTYVSVSSPLLHITTKFVARFLSIEEIHGIEVPLPL